MCYMHSSFDILSGLILICDMLVNYEILSMIIYLNLRCIIYEISLWFWIYYYYLWINLFLSKRFICYQGTLPLFHISLFPLVCIFYSHDWSILPYLIPMLSYLCFLILGEIHIVYIMIFIACELTLLFYGNT